MRLQIDNHGEIENIDDVIEARVHIIRSNGQERIVNLPDVRGVRRIDHDWEDTFATG
jgi:hypothetical protein